MKKIFFALAAVVMLTACGRYESENVSVEELAAALSYAADLDGEISENLMVNGVAARYGISVEEIEGGAVFRCGDDADELIIAKAVNHDALRNVEMALESEVNDLTAAWKYDAEERRKTEKHVLKTRGMYVLMVVCEDSDRVERVFDNMVRG